MMEFMVRVSRAWWHSGDVVIEAATEEEALQKALERADDIDLKDWGEVVDLGHQAGRPVEDLLHNNILQEAFVMGAQGKGEVGDPDRREEDPEEAGQAGVRSAGDDG